MRERRQVTKRLVILLCSLTPIRCALEPCKGLGIPPWHDIANVEKRCFLESCSLHGSATVNFLLGVKAA